MPPLLSLALLGCREQEDSLSGHNDDHGDTRSDEGGQQPGLPPPLVMAVTPRAPPDGLVSAILLEPGRELVMSIGGVEQPVIWGPGTSPTLRLWRLPSHLEPGPVDLVFQSPQGHTQTITILVVERWFEEVSERIGLGGPHKVEGWSSSCAESLMGFGFADLDLDGDQDLIRGQLTAPSQLLLNEGDTDGDGLPNFTDRSALLGFFDHDYVVSVHPADYDNDGDQDLFLGRWGPNRLLQNRRVPDGLLRFVDVTAQAGLAIDQQRTTGGAWGDYDGDGDLDLYEVNHTWCFPPVDLVPNSGDHLYRNDGDGTFTEVTDMLPDYRGQVSGRFGFAAVFIDIDRDHDQDLWVVNDHIEGTGKSVHWRNDGPGEERWRFVDVSDGSGLAPERDAFGKTINGMGTAVGDINRDGLPDFVVSNIGPNLLMLSEVGAGPGAPLWADAAYDLGVQRSTLPWTPQSVTWGVHLLDLDLDRDLDLFYVGGPIKGSEFQPNALFDNAGEVMLDRTWEAGVAAPLHGGASAQVDLDGDGYLELVVANWGGPLTVLHNRLGDRYQRHWLVVEPVGDGRLVNRNAFGAIVELTHLDGTVDTCFRTPMPSMSASGDWGCHFGLGEAAAVQRVTVVWPDGSEQTIEAPAVDQRLRIPFAP